MVIQIGSVFVVLQIVHWSGDLLENPVLVVFQVSPYCKEVNWNDFVLMVI